MLHRGSDFCDVCYTAEVTSVLYATPQKFRKIQISLKIQIFKEKAISLERPGKGCN